MGNKINAHGIRVGINKNWKSIWYQPKNQYADTLLQDIKIRDLVEKKLKNAGVAEVVVKRSMTKIVIEVVVARPGVVIGRGGGGIETLKADLKKLAKTDVEIKVFEVKRPEIEAKLVAESIAAQCERRISPKLAMRKAIAAARETGAIKGITIWVGGRIRGAEIARTEKEKWGVVPRHTLRADIDYAFAEAQVPGAGKHGIKVWINKGEKQGYDTER
jgi:small subunit ribosomal protein S3